MKKLLTLSAVAMILSGCATSGEEVKSKPVNVEGNTNSGSNTSTKIDAIDYEEAEEILKLYTGVNTLPAPVVMATSLGDKTTVGNKEVYKLEISELVDAYNAIRKDVVSKESVLKEFSSLSKLETINSAYDEKVISEKSGTPGLVLYFEGSGDVALVGMPPVGATGGFKHADRDQWKLEDNAIVVPIKMVGGGAPEQDAGTVKLLVNNKNYTGGESKYNYYVDDTGAKTAKSNSSTKASSESTTTKVTTTKVETTQTKSAPKGNGLSSYAGTYVGSNGSTITISDRGEFIVDGQAMDVDVEASGGSLSLIPSNWKSNMNPPIYSVEKGKVIAQFRGSMVEYTKK